MNYSPSLAAVLTFLLALAVVPANAANSHGAHHHHHDQMSKKTAEKSPSTEAFEKGNEAMHRGMNINFTGDADIDFVAGMIPHHEGAVAMAEVVLAYGENAEVRVGRTKRHHQGLTSPVTYPSGTCRWHCEAMAPVKTIYSGAFCVWPCGLNKTHG